MWVETFLNHNLSAGWVALCVLWSWATEHLFVGSLAEVTRRDQLSVKKAKKVESDEKVKAKGQGKGENMVAEKGKGARKKTAKGKNGTGCAPDAESDPAGKAGENPGADGEGPSGSRKKGKPAKPSEDVDMESAALPASQKHAVKNKVQPETDEPAPKAKAPRRKYQESKAAGKTEKTEKVSHEPKAEQVRQADVVEAKTWARRSRPKSSAGALKWDTLKAVFIRDVRPCLRSNVSAHEEWFRFKLFPTRRPHATGNVGVLEIEK